MIAQSDEAMPPSLSMTVHTTLAAAGRFPKRSNVCTDRFANLCPTPATRSTRNLRIRCGWPMRSQAMPLLPNAFAPPTQRSGPPKRSAWTRDEPACRTRSAAAVSFLLAATVSVSMQYTLPAGGLRCRRERVRASGHDDIYRPTSFPLPKLTGWYAPILRSRATEQSWGRERLLIELLISVPE